MIFSRGRRRRHARDEQERRDEDPRADSLEQGARGPVRGPYDVTEAPAGVERLDLGSLQIPAVAGVEVRVQANQNGVIQQVVLVHDNSALEVAAFAAPRTEDVWDEVREKLRASLVADGAPVEEIPGDYGTELRARVPTETGPTEVRFVGIDGPRWMVRAVYQGRAAADPSYAGPLAEALAGLVVVRGQEAKPVLEPLPLRLPREVTNPTARPGADSPAAANGADPADQSRTSPRPRPSG